MTNIVKTLESEMMKQNIPEFKAGDTVVVNVKVFAKIKGRPLQTLDQYSIRIDF